jgi:hypothetical protein
MLIRGQAALKNPVGNNLPTVRCLSRSSRHNLEDSVKKSIISLPTPTLPAIASGIPRGIDTGKVGACMARLR